MTLGAVTPLVSVVGFGILLLRLRTLPERMAHRTHKLQFEIVAVLGLLAPFTHIRLFWVLGLLLALIDLPDFGTPMNRMADSLERPAPAPLSGGEGDRDDAAPVEGHGREAQTVAQTVAPAPAPPQTVGARAMLELLLCSLFTVVPDYLYRRYVQGKRLGREIALYSV